MIHAVIDTNVLVSALLTSKSDAATVQVLDAVMNGHIIPITGNLKHFPNTPTVVTPAQLLDIL